MSDTVNIRGKAYVTVAGRVAAAHEAGGFTMPEPPELIHIGERTFCRVLIEVAASGQRFYGTAEVKWNAPKGTADHDSPLECAETSAVGRALGFAGFGSVEGIASADEVRRNESLPPAAASANGEAGERNYRNVATIADGRDPQAKPSPQIMERIVKACAQLGVDRPAPEQLRTQEEAEARLAIYIAEWKRQADLRKVEVLPA